MGKFGFEKLYFRGKKIKFKKPKVVRFDLELPEEMENVKRIIIYVERNRTP